MRHPYRTALFAITTAVVLTSCSWTQPFRLTVTVVDQKDGTPLFGCKVGVDANFNDTQENQHNREPVPWADVAANGVAEAPAVIEQRKANSAWMKWRTTDLAGRAECDFSIHGYTKTQSGSKRWDLAVRKEGYEPVLIDFKPDPLPEGGRDVIPLTLTVKMRRAEAPPR